MTGYWHGTARFRCTKRSARTVELLPGDIVLRDAKPVDLHQLYPAAKQRAGYRRYKQPGRNG